MGSIAGLAAALAVMPDRELRALRAAIDGEPVIAPGLLVWLESGSRLVCHERPTIVRTLKRRAPS
jgi:hypothetical protein